MKSKFKKIISIITVSLIMTFSSSSCMDPGTIKALIHMANQIMALMQSNVSGGIQWAGEGVAGGISWAANGVEGTIRRIICGNSANDCDNDSQPSVPPLPSIGPTGFNVPCSRNPPVTTGLNIWYATKNTDGTYSYPVLEWKDCSNNNVLTDISFTLHTPPVTLGIQVCDDTTCSCTLADGCGVTTQDKTFNQGDWYTL